mmetsp:Transcript_148119/g.258428  ORF Transcript_148119/g.258428 Transcript_148119/m.258428 type:complete len:587 (-) Transcript_148119:97-1857(-)
MAMSAQQHLSKLKASAGDRIDEPYLLLLKLFDNIKKHPDEERYRRINLQNSKIQSELLCFDGAQDFFSVAGFVVDSSGSKGDSLVLPGHAAVAFSDALVALQRSYAMISDEKQRAAVKEEKDASFHEQVRDVLAKSVQGVGRLELDAIAKTPEGRESLQVLQRVLTNLRRFPDGVKYRSICLEGKSGQKLRKVQFLLHLSGFEVVRRAKSPEQEEVEHAEIANVDVDVVERINAMVFWTLNTAAQDIQLPFMTGSMKHALGAVLGAAVGDALGTALEMSKLTFHLPVTAQELDKALEMCGGGRWGVAPGQITDDTEMQIMLAEGLATAAEASAFPSDVVAKNYHDWGASGPFDIGITTRQAVWGRNYAAVDMEHRAWEMNMNSQSNGALMRCMPLAVWCCARKFDAHAIVAAAHADAKLTHSNHTVGSANAAYVLAMTQLIHTCGDRASALEAVENWKAEELEKSSPGSENLSKWLQEAMAGEPLHFGPEYGWSKIAFTHAFRHLQIGSDFATAMKLTMVGGGDTDTNAAIVGGLVGAAVGLDAIPVQWIRGVMAADSSTGSPRPDRFHPKRLPALVQQIFQGAAR